MKADGEDLNTIQKLWRRASVLVVKLDLTNGHARVPCGILTDAAICGWTTGSQSPDWGPRILPLRAKPNSITQRNDILQVTLLTIRGTLRKDKHARQDFAII